MDEPASTLDRASALEFTIALANGRTVATVGEAVSLCQTLDERQRATSHWCIAMKMLDQAMREPPYLKAATLSLQTALAMDGLLDHMQ